MYPFVKLTGWRTPRRHPEPCKRGKYGRAYILSCFLRPPPLLKGGIIKSLPLKGETTYYILRVASAPSSLLLLTHWIFGSLMLPYKSSSHSASTAVTDSLDFQVADAPLQIQFASAKCVRCASLRGPPIGGQDRDGASYRCSAPYTLSRFAGLPLKGKREI